MPGLASHEQRLRFLHIPKSAGSALANVLTREYRGYGRFEFSGETARDIERFRALSREDQDSVRLFTGHAPLVSGLPEADGATIITMLRDPISRVKSLCQHVWEGKSVYLQDEFPAGGFSLDDFLGSGHIELANHQTRILTGTYGAACCLDTKSESVCRDAALTNLFEKVAHFGLKEYFDESLFLMASALGWGMPLYGRLNTPNPARLLDFEDRHIERIAELNRVDIQVYDAAKARFEASLRAPDVDTAKLKRFRRLQAWLPCGYYLADLRNRGRAFCKRWSGRSDR